jgi:hypothetical protein
MHTLTAFCFLVSTLAHSPTLAVEPITQNETSKNAYSIVAHVVRDDGSIAEGARVLLMSHEAMLGFPMLASERLPDASTGRVLFEHVAPTGYTVIARWEQPVRLLPHEHAKVTPNAGDLPTTPPVWWGFLNDVKPGTTVHEIMLAPGAKQEFRVTNSNGDLVSQVQIRAALRSSDGFMANANSVAFPTITLDRRITANDGRFALDGLAPGEWVCVLAAANYGRTEPFTLAVPSRGIREILVPKFLSISGEIHAPEGMSNAKVWVGVSYPDSYVLVSEDGQVAANLDSAGKFEIRNVRPGRARLRAESVDADRRVCKSKEIEIILEPGKDLHGVQLDLVAVK